jgi:L-alanine-DL-glutamate epimerase-like enolase superfamily enzyme
VKMAPRPPDSEEIAWSRALRGMAQRVEAIGKAIGEDVDIGLDPHARIFEPYKARELA